MRLATRLRKAAPMPAATRVSVEGPPGPERTISKRVGPAGTGPAVLTSSVLSPAVIVIVGGGMVGASLACALAAGGHFPRVALVEGFPLVDRGGPAVYQPSFDARRQKSFSSP